MKSIIHFNDCKTWINEFYKFKLKQNKSYTIRKFAIELGISKTALNDVLLGKRKFSKKSIEKISAILKFSENEKAHFINLIKPIKKYNDSPFIELSENDFKLMSEWYFIGIICYAQMKDNFADPKYLSKKFGISSNEAQNALDILLRLKLIEIKNEKFYRTTNPININPGIPSSLIRNYHKQNLKKAEFAIDNFHMNERLFTSISIPSNKNKIREISSLVNSLKNKIADSLGTTEPENVYTISIQVFPITKN